MANLSQEEKDLINQEFDLTIMNYNDIVDIEVLNEDIQKVAKKVLENPGGLLHYNSINELFFDPEGLGQNHNENERLSTIIRKMKVPSILRDFVPQNEKDYPINGLLEIYKYEEYSARIRLDGESNDLYILSVNLSNWNDTFPEDIISDTEMS